MVIEAAKGGHTQVVKLLLEYPNRMLMNTQQDLPQITATDSHLVEVSTIQPFGMFIVLDKRRYTQIDLVKILFFNQKLLIFFLFLYRNICYGYSLEAPHASNEYPQCMFFVE